MRNLLCDKTFAQINDLIERINTAIDDNVRDITDVNNHSKKVIFKYHTFDGVEHNIYASNANAIAMVDDNENAEMLTPAEDDTLYVFGDKNGITIHAVAPADTAQHSWFNESITVDHLNDDIFYRIECDNTYNDSEGSVDQDFVMYEIGGLKAGRAYTLNITARASIINYDANDLKLVVLDDDGTTVITQQALTKDTSPHDYTVTFTAPDTTVYLKFVLAAIDDFSGSVTNREEFVISKFLFTGMDIGIIDLKFYNNGQWYSVGTGGGSSNVELIEISKADYDALPQSAKDDPNKAYFVYNYPSGSGGSGGASALVDLSDVDISNPSNGQVLKYNGTSHAWENAAESGGGSYPAEGAVKWDSTDGHLYSYQNGSWVALTLTAQQFIPTSVRIVTTSTSPSGAAVAYGDPDESTSTYTTVVFTSVQTTPLNIENIFTIAYPSPWKIKSLIDGLKFTNNSTGVEQILNTGDEISWTYNTSIDYTLSNV